VYYSRLLHYAAIAKPRLFHILWNNKFQFFDRTLLTLYYKSLGKRVVLTLHNVNAGKRDLDDTALNRLTLKIQYRLSDHIFVHSEKMKVELVEDFGIRESRVTVIPFGINNAVPNTCLSPIDAKQRLGMSPGDKAMLFFGNIVPYKGLEYLVSAFRQIKTQCREYRLIIAGRPNNCENYWRPIREALREDIENGRVILRTAYIPDEETELYFKAADVCILPYRRVYQSGVLFLGYSFGLPVLAADVGSLSEDIVEGRTGFVFRREDANDLAAAIERYFSSDLYAELTRRRHEIIEYANQRHSWDIVGRMTIAVYSHLLRLPSSELSNVRGGPAVDANGSHESAPRRVPVAPRYGER
jgi:glycosyltransferase involved in cell wall biosynthesis